MESSGSGFITLLVRPLLHLSRISWAKGPVIVEFKIGDKWTPVNKVGAETMAGLKKTKK